LMGNCEACGGSTQICCAGRTCKTGTCDGTDHCP
jgi:hypothetical protein